MFAQMVASHEALVAYGTGEPFLPSVGTKVPLEFIRPCEALTTKQPVTHKRPLACVPSEVSLEVGGFAVYFATTRDVTAVDALSA